MSRCMGMELDPVYCDVIVKRWEEQTGKKANLEGAPKKKRAKKPAVKKGKKA